MPLLAQSRQRSRGFAGELGTPGAVGRAVVAVPDEWPLRIERRSEPGFGWRLFRGVGAFVGQYTLFVRDKAVDGVRSRGGRRAGMRGSR